MGNSRRRGPFDPPLGLVQVPARTCGPLGYNDHGDPTLTTLLGDTPGSLGWFDHADPALSGGLRLALSTRLSDGTAVSVGDKQAALATAADGGTRKLTLEQLKKIF